MDLIRWVAALLLYLTLIILNVRQYNDVVSYTFCLRTRLRELGELSRTPGLQSEWIKVGEYHGQSEEKECRGVT